MTDTRDQADGTADGIERLWSLRSGVFKATAPDGTVTLAAPPHIEVLGRLDPAQHTALAALAERPPGGGRPPRPAAGPAPDPDDKAPAAAGAVAHLLERLRSGGWLAATLTHAGRPLYTLDPLAPAPPRPAGTDGPLRLSRFAVIRRDARGLLVESPRAWCELRLHDPALLPDVVAPAPPGAPGSGVAARLRADLRWAGLAVPYGSQDAPGDPGGQSAGGTGDYRAGSAPDGPGAGEAGDAGGDEDLDPALRQWTPHELWFHHRSRLGRSGTLGVDFGGTWWGRRAGLPAPPARRAPYPGPPLPLAREAPAAEAVEGAGGGSLADVLARRRSVRRHDDLRPLTAERLGAFLYRCASTRAVREADGFEYAVRPHPSGGSAYELELYPVVRRVAGLDPGMYHYDSHAHALRRVAGPNDLPVRRLLRTAATSSGSDEPQVLLVVSARVGRLMWKYEQMTYALVLKHVGVLCQTMYLVATDLGLAPCALGSGDSAAFTEATGTLPYEECAVGEFMLGSLPTAPEGESAG